MQEQRTRISVNLAKTINLGNYQSLRVDVGMSSDVESEETPDGAFRRVERQVSDWLKAECAPVERSLQSKGTNRKEK